MKPNFDNKTPFELGLALPIDKPYHWTSADVVRKLKNKLKALGYKKIKIGHAGTLDPLATGILVVCIGKATKRAEEIQAQRKEYIAEVELGATTPCFDLEKEVDQRYPFEHITKEMVEQTLNSFLGEQLQVPPIFSAKLIDGKRAYKYARAGEEVEMRKALIEVYAIELLEFDLPRVKIRIECSKGTYIRSIARDLGVKLESGGHLTSLVRSRNGEFTLSDCYSLEEAASLMEPDMVGSNE